YAVRTLACRQERHPGPPSRSRENNRGQGFSPLAASSYGAGDSVPPAVRDTLHAAGHREPPNLPGSLSWQELVSPGRNIAGSTTNPGVASAGCVARSSANAGVGAAGRVREPTTDTRVRSGI